VKFPGDGSTEFGFRVDHKVDGPATAGGGLPDWQAGREVLRRVLAPLRLFHIGGTKRSWNRRQTVRGTGLRPALAPPRSSLLRPARLGRGRSTDPRGASGRRRKNGASAASQKRGGEGAVAPGDVAKGRTGLPGIGRRQPLDRWGGRIDGLVNNAGDRRKFAASGKLDALDGRRTSSASTASTPSARTR